MDAIKREEVEAGELSRGIQAWRDDPYGMGAALRGKRSARGWSVEQEQRLRTEVVNGKELSNRQNIMSFLDWLREQQNDGGTYIGQFPWS